MTTSDPKAMTTEELLSHRRDVETWLQVFVEGRYAPQHNRQANIYRAYIEIASRLEALRARADELHDQRHEEARKADESRAEVLRLRARVEELERENEEARLCIDDTVRSLHVHIEAIKRLEKQREDLQAANTAMRRELELAASGKYTAESLEWWARKALDALRESTDAKKELDS
jgi:chromosome segregation ATPase